MIAKIKCFRIFSMISFKKTLFQVMMSRTKSLLLELGYNTQRRAKIPSARTRLVRLVVHPGSGKKLLVFEIASHGKSPVPENRQLRKIASCGKSPVAENRQEIFVTMPKIPLFSPTNFSPIKVFKSYRNKNHMDLTLVRYSRICIQ